MLKSRNGRPLPKWAGRLITSWIGLVSLAVSMATSVTTYRVASFLMMSQGPTQFYHGLDVKSWPSCINLWPQFTKCSRWRIVINAIVSPHKPCCKEFGTKAWCRGFASFKVLWWLRARSDLIIFLDFLKNRSWSRHFNMHLGKQGLPWNCYQNKILHLPKKALVSKLFFNI